MSNSQLPPEIQEKIVKYQQYQNQLRSLYDQLSFSKSKSLETKKTLEELQSLDNSTEIYKLSGSVLFKSDVESVRKALEDEKEFLEIQLKKLQKNEEMLRDRLKEIEQELTNTQ